jgi:SSS family solute:Na+ symporter
LFDLLIICVYFLFVLYLGWNSRLQSPESYWMAERQYSSGRITLSLVATIFGASSTMGVIGLGYSRGLTAAWWSLIGGVALIPCAFLLASRIRALQVYTLPDILRHAYGERVAVPAGVIIAVAWCGVVAAQLVAGGRLIGGLFSLNFDVTLMIVAMVFICYTFWGGQLSVIKTDSWQLGLFVSGLVICLGFLIWNPGSSSGLWENVPKKGLQFPVSEDFGWYDLAVFYPLIVGLPYLVGPDIYSRILCAKDERVARRAVLFASMVVIPLSFLIALFGLLAHGRFPHIAPETALPKTLTTLVPAGLKGLIVAGFLGAIMSSADTCLISASTILTLNVFQPFYKTTRETYFKITRAMVLLLGAAAWFIASRQAGIISSLLMGYTVFVGGVVIPTLGTFFRKWLTFTPNGALWAVILGGTTAILGKIGDGAIMKAALTHQGTTLLEAALGPGYLSVFPIALSSLILILASRPARGPCP